MHLKSALPCALERTFLLLDAPGSPTCRRAVLSDGRKIDSPRFLRRAEKKLRRLQRELSRKAKGSKNGQGARQEATVVIAAINVWR